MCFLQSQSVRFDRSFRSNNSPMNAHWNGAKLEIGCIEKICEQLCLWSLAKNFQVSYRILFFFKIFQQFSIIDNEKKGTKRGKGKIRNIENHEKECWSELREKWMGLRKNPIIEVYMWSEQINWLSNRLSRMRSFVRNIESAARYKSQLRIEQVAGKAEPKT